MKIIWLDYDYIKNHYTLIAVDLSMQKKLGADSKAIQQIEFLGQSKNPDNAIVASESRFVLALLEEKNLSKTTTQLNKLKFEINKDK